MNKNKEVLKYCPNFYKIVNFVYDENDYITDKLIKLMIFNIISFFLLEK